jgi:hypothetical protein
MLGVQTPFLFLSSAAVLTALEVFSMDKQSKPAVAQIGNHCHFCGNGQLLSAPSGVNLICDACNRIMLVRQHWTVAEGRSTTGFRKGRGRPTKDGR